MKSQPENRITGLWKLLIGTQKPLRLDAAAAALDVSEKTVRRDLTRLNQILQDTDCKVELHKGTCILQGLSRDAEDVMSALQTGIPETQSERVDWLASWFLMNGKATLQSLADRLYISESTIKHDLNVLKNKLKPFQLSLERCSSGLRLEGPEEQVRNCLMYWMRAGRIRPDFGLDASQVSCARQAIQNMVDQADLTMDEAGMQNLLLHLEIAGYRIRNGQVLENTGTTPAYLWQLAADLTEAVASAWSLDFPPGETENLAWHIAAQKQSDALHEDEEQKRILTSAVQETMVAVDRIYGTSLARDSVMAAGLAAHLSVVLVRLRHDMVIDNPILKEIRSQYPYAMEIAQLAAVQLQDMLGCPIPLSEIGYLAVHIGGSLVRSSKHHTRRKKAAVVCTTGMGTSLLLLARISEQFGDDLDVTGTFTLRQALELSAEDADVILSTVRLPETVRLPWLQITPLLTDSDVFRIQNHLQRVRFPISIQSLFHDGLFFRDLNFTDRSDILDFLSDQLLSQGYIDSTACASFATRETLGTTEIGNMVAVPHCMEGTVHTPAIAVAILSEPVLWEFSLVQVVLMIAVSGEFLRKENEFFLRLYKQLASPAMIRNLIQTRHLDLLKDAFTKEEIG